MSLKFGDGVLDPRMVPQESLQAEKMQCHSLTNIVRTCVRMGALQQGRHIIQEQVLRNMESESDTLDEAFDAAECRDAVLWTDRITANARKGHYKDALLIFRLMQLHGVLADDVALTAALTACSTPQALPDGKLLHSCAKERGYDSLTFLGTALVTMYGRCHSLADAEMCFEAITSRNVVTWTSLLTTYVDHGCFSKAVVCFRAMQLDGIKPNKVTFVAAANAVAQDVQTRSFSSLFHALMVESGVELDGLAYTALIGLYSRCGDWCSAEELFLGSSSKAKDWLPTWNAMLGVYSQHGECSEKGARLFRCMLLEGKQPDRVTFLALLGSCNRLSLGKHIHSCVAHAGLQTSPVLGAALMSMYGHCGGLNHALEIFQAFKELGRELDVVFWNSVVGACADKQPRLAIELFQEMHVQGVKLNSVTFVSVLTACAASRNLCYGKLVHAQLVSKGTEVADDVVQNSLLNMFAKCGSCENAWSLFTGLKRWSVISCTAMLSALVETGQHAEAQLLFRRMMLEGVQPNRITLITMVDAVGTVAEADLIHACLKLRGEDSTPEVAPALVTLFGRMKSFSRAREAFELADDQRDVLLWNSFLLALSQASRREKPIFLFHRMLQGGVLPDKVTLVTLLQDCSNLQETQMIRTAIGELGYASDTVLNTGLLKAYGSLRSTDRAGEVFREMLESDAVSWSAMLTVYADNGYEDKAIHLLKEMQLQGMKPVRATFAKALNACTAKRDVLQGKMIHSNAEAAGFTSDGAVGTALVSLYGKLREPDAAQEIFERMHHKDVCSWTALLSAYTDSGRHEEALQTFWRMQQAGVQEDKISLIAALSASMAVNYSLDSSVLDRQELLEDTSAATSLLDMQGKLGTVSSARFVFEKMRRKDTVAWNAILGVYARHGHVVEVMETFQRMQVEGVGVDSGTLASLIVGCSRSGLVEEGCRFFSLMEEFGVERSEQNYACIVDLLGRCGQLEEAHGVVHTREGEADHGAFVMLWKTLLSACKENSDVWRGYNAASCILDVEPNNAEAFVLLSNLNTKC